MSYTLPALPYAYTALEPHIDAQTMEIHHTKHHQTYINNLINAVKDTPFDGKPAEELIVDLNALPENIRGVVRNNGGGHANHSLFWTVMAPAGEGGGGAPDGELTAAIDRDLGGLDAFKDAFTKAALTRFGSGWAWLSTDKSGKLLVESTIRREEGRLLEDGPGVVSRHAGVDVVIFAGALGRGAGTLALGAAAMLGCGIVSEDAF